MPDDWVIAKLDFKNAFNTVHRSWVLRAVSEKIPELFSFCKLAYGSPSKLRFGDLTIWSCEGVQQGDPLGPLLFCIAVQPFLSNLQSVLRIGFLDDVTLGGPASTVGIDVVSFSTACSGIGLDLNVTKCELISKNQGQLPDSLRAFIQLTPDNASCLGTPLLVGAVMNSLLNNMKAKLSRAFGRLSLISAHDALIILRSCLGAANMIYMLRSSPCSDHPCLPEIDTLLRRAASDIFNVVFSDDQWLQASLPISWGGLGIRSVSLLAPSAHLASAAGTSDLQSRILGHSDYPKDQELDRVSVLWSSLCPNEDTMVLSTGRQHDRDSRVCKSLFHTLLARQESLVDRARLLAVSAPHSSDWLHALPISACGLRLDNEAIRVAVGLRLGSKLCEPHVCSCGAHVDHRGLHGLVCRKSAGRIGRHQHLNDVICRTFIKAGIPSVKEPPGLSRTDGKRPDGATQIPWSSGKCLIWDVTVTDTLAASNLPLSSTAPGEAAEFAAEKKVAKYALLSDHYIFQPIAFETLGPVNQTALNFIGSLGLKSQASSGDSRSGSFLWQRLSVVIQRYNAVCLLGTFATLSEGSC